MAKNIRAGDTFDGETVTDVRVTDRGNASIRLEGGSWRRRPADERVPVER